MEDWSVIALLFFLLGVGSVVAILTFGWGLLTFLGKRIDRIDSLRRRIRHFLIEKIFGVEPLD